MTIKMKRRFAAQRNIRVIEAELNVWKTQESDVWSVCTIRHEANHKSASVFHLNRRPQRHREVRLSGFQDTLEQTIFERARISDRDLRGVCTHSLSAS